jgi:tRNA pseudouridine13 synthase
LKSLLDRIHQTGVPNYFGEQRFGRGGNNLVNASKWLDQGRRIDSCGPKAIIMSAARSYIFNLYLSERVKQGNWAEIIEGDAQNELGQALGPMWGRGKSNRTALALGIEKQVYEGFEAWLNGLEHCGLNQEGRPLVLKPQAFSWRYEGKSLDLEFELLPGQYATAILDEIAILMNNSAAPIE